MVLCEGESPLRQEGAVPASVCSDDEFLYARYLQSGKCFEEFTRGGQFMEASIGQVQCLLEKDGIMVSSEDEVYYALKRWYRWRCESRERAYLDALSSVRLPLASERAREYIISEVSLFSEKHADELRSETTEYCHAFARDRARLDGMKTKPRTAYGVQKFLYVLGSSEPEWGQLLQCYDFQKQEWSLVDDAVPFTRKQFAVTAFNGCVWVAGGRIEGRGSVRDVNCFDPITRKWTKECDMKEPRHGFGLTVYDGKIYAVGGRNENGTLNSMEVYDSLEWTTGAPMLWKRYNLDVVTVCRKIFAAGGWLPEEDKCVKPVEYYDPETLSWYQPLFGGDIPQVRVECRMVVMDDLLYIVGGGKNQQVEEYNFPSCRWNPSPFILEPGRRYHAAAAVDGLIYVIGGVGYGRDVGKCFQSVDPAEGAIERLKEPPEKPGVSARAVVVTYPMPPCSGAASLRV